MNIGLFIGAVNGVFSTDIVKAMEKSCAEYGATLHVFGSFAPPDSGILHAEGEKSAIYIADLKNFDTLIVAGDTLARFDLHGELMEHIKREATCPVIGLRFREDGMYNVLSHNENDIYRMTKHFLDDHHFTDICFVVGRLDLLDAQERFRGYKKAMEEAGIPITEDMIYFGDYWRSQGQQIVSHFMKSRGHLPSAIICSNDFMALSVCDEVKRLKYRIPKDICISGYDNIEEGQMYIPPLTSVDADFARMGQRAIDLAVQINNHEDVPKDNWIDSNIKLRKSCGCSRDKVEYNKDIYIDLINKGKMDVLNCVYMAADFENTVTEGECFEWVKFYLKSSHIDTCFICLKKQELFGTEDNEKDSTTRKKMTPAEKAAANRKAARKMRLRYVIESDGSAHTEDIPFDQQNYLPEQYASRLEGKTNIFLPIHCKNEVYGYFIFQMKSSIEGILDTRFECLSMFLGNALKKMYMNQSLFSMKDVMRLYLKDPLTNIYNRRGFEQNFLELYNNSKHENFKIAVVSIDMDGLKYINDLFGHQKGDDALVSLSNAISKSMEADEICARMGGDEFEAVLILRNPERPQAFRNELKRRLAQVNKRIKENYKVDASVGICVVEEQAHLEEYIQYADKLMYEEKNSKVDKQGLR